MAYTIVFELSFNTDLFVEIRNANANVNANASI